MCGFRANNILTKGLYNSRCQVKLMKNVLKDLMHFHDQYIADLFHMWQGSWAHYCPM